MIYKLSNAICHISSTHLVGLEEHGEGVQTESILKSQPVEDWDSELNFAALHSSENIICQQPRPVVWFAFDLTTLSCGFCLQTKIQGQRSNCEFLIIGLHWCSFKIKSKQWHHYLHLQQKKIWIFQAIPLEAEAAAQQQFIVIHTVGVWVKSFMMPTCVLVQGSLPSPLLRKFVFQWRSSLLYSHTMNTWETRGIVVNVSNDCVWAARWERRNNKKERHPTLLPMLLHIYSAI